MFIIDFDELINAVATTRIRTRLLQTRGLLDRGSLYLHCSLPVLNVSTKGQFLIKTRVVQIETVYPYNILSYCILPIHYGLRDPAFFIRKDDLSRNFNHLTTLIVSSAGICTLIRR